MNIIIVGCGKVGATLTEQLSQEDNNVCVIDQDSATVQKLVSAYDVMGINGNGASYSILVEAGIEKADLLIAVTGQDELNLFCCIIAKKAGSCQTIARVRNPVYRDDHQFIKEELGLSMIINPEYFAAMKISQLLCFPNAVTIDIFAKGRCEMLSFKVTEDSILDNMQLRNIQSKIGSEILVCAVERDREVRIPNGYFTIQAGDVISVIASRAKIMEFARKMKMKLNPVKNTMIVGGGNVTVYLAKMLIKSGIDVKIIEQDINRCEELSEQLPEAVIVNGDGSDMDFLLEERIEQTDSFVAMTDIDEENIILSLYAKKKVKSKVISKINRLAVDDILQDLDLDCLVYPKKLTAERILQYVRATQNSIGSNIETLYRYFDDRVEALEFNIQENPKLTNIPLMDLELKEDILIACISRENKIIIPGGQDVIKPGDSVIVVTTKVGLKDAQDILKD